MRGTVQGRSRGRGAPPAPAWLGELEPRKRPSQARSHATFAAIVDACARLLAKGGYDTLTTNAIAERAGVSIGTLYEYFPNRESIVAALAGESCRRLVARMRGAVEETAGMAPLAGVEHLIGAGVEALRAPENVFTALVREAPFVLRLPPLQEAREALTQLCQDIRIRAAGTVRLPDPQADTWLISQMLFNAMLEIALLDEPEGRRRLLQRELARLTYRMAVGCDPPDAVSE
jgi:AcrR family transcriptional regulator